MENGFSLIELLIATALSFFLLVGASALYLNSQQIYIVQEASASLQENARYLIYQMRHTVQMAGYIGCSRLGEVKLHAFLPQQTLTAANFLQGFRQGMPIDNRLLTIANHTVPGSDILLIQEMAAASVAASGSNKLIHEEEKFNTAANDILILSDCIHADVFQVSSSYFNELTPSQALAYQYKSENSQLGLLHAWVYYVARTTRKNKAGSPIDALYRRDLNASSKKQSEWVEGVENMHIYYGIVEPSGNISYLSADKIADWQQVQSLQIHLLLSSPEAVKLAKNYYEFDGKKQQAPDKRLRQEWTLVVALRNRE
jgi:type IV pilus assembly protein PilW